MHAVITVQGWRKQILSGGNACEARDETLHSWQWHHHYFSNSWFNPGLESLQRSLVGWCWRYIAFMNNTVQLEVFVRRKFHHCFAICMLSLAKILSTNFFFSCIKGCIADMVTFTALTKILSLEKYYNTKIYCWARQNFIPWKCLAID